MGLVKTPILGRLPPKSPIGVAIRYTLNQWEALGRFLDDARIPLDNNPAEAALRRVALGRNYAEPRIMRCGAALETSLPMSRARSQVAVAA